MGFKKELSEIKISSFLPDDNLTLYSSKGKADHLSDDNPDVNTDDNPPGRDCTDIAAKLAFEIQGLLSQAGNTTDTQTTTEIDSHTLMHKVIDQISNQFYFDPNGKL